MSGTAKGSGTYWPRKRNGKLTGRWAGQITVRGLTRTFSGASKAECQALCQAWAVEQRKRGHTAPGSTMAFGDYLNLWLSEIEPSVAPSSLTTYRWSVSKLPSSLTSTRLDNLERRLLQRTITDLARSLSLAGTRLVRAVISRALNDAVEWDYLASHSAHRLRIPKGETPESTAWDDGECQAFLDVADRHPWRAIWWITLATGLRNGEARALRWEDINRQTGAIRIRRKLDESARVTSQPKGRRLRTVAIRGPVLRVIQELPAQRTGYLVTDDAGEPVTGHAFRVAFREIVAESGVTPINVHGLRHTAITQMLLAGVPLHIVSKVAGHSSPTITGKVYAHVLHGDAERAAEAMAATLSRPRRATETA